MPIPQPESCFGELLVIKLLIHILLTILACTPSILLVWYLQQKYPSDISFFQFNLVEGILLIGALCLPVFLLPRLGVDWRSQPDNGSKK